MEELCRITSAIQLQRKKIEPSNAYLIWIDEDQQKYVLRLFSQLFCELTGATAALALITVNLQQLSTVCKQSYITIKHVSHVNLRMIPMSSMQQGKTTDVTFGEKQKT